MVEKLVDRLQKYTSAGSFLWLKNWSSVDYSLFVTYFVTLFVTYFVKLFVTHFVMVFVTHFNAFCNALLWTIGISGFQKGG